MSWPLFAHNLPTEVSVGSSYPTDGGGAYTATNIFLSTTGIGSGLHYYLAENGGPIFSAGRVNDKIMMMDSPEGALWFSDDWGDTWTERTSFTYPTAGDYVGSVMYDEALDIWYVSVYDDGPRQIHAYRSLDDGVTWAEFNDLNPHTYSNAMTLFDDGTIAIGSRTKSFRHYASPSTSNVYTEFADDVDISNPLMVWKVASGYIGLADNGFYTWPTDWTSTPTDYKAYSAHPTYSYWVTSGETTDALVSITSLTPASGILNANVLTYGDTVTTLPTLAYDFGLTLYSLGIAYQDDGWILCGSATGTRDVVHFTRSSGTAPTGFHTTPNTLTLSASLIGALNDNDVQWYHAGGSRWLIAYVDVLGYHRLDTFTYGGSVNHATAANSGLRRAIESQRPDIFMQFDDAAASTTVLDTGSKGYVNAVIGTPAFETAALNSDGGTSMLLNSATDQCVSVYAAVTPVEHAHVFLLSQDGTATIRVLAASQIEHPDYDSYTIQLSADHKLSYSTYKAGVRVTTTTTTALATDTATLVAVRIKDAGDTVTFYIDTAQDLEVTALGIITPIFGHYSIAGLLDTDTRDSNVSGADGVTIDYYALIPNTSFNYYDLTTAVEGDDAVAYVPPEVDAAGIPKLGAQFLGHFDEAATTGPNPSLRVPGIDYYDFVNSVPDTPNRISTTATADRFTTGKFNTGLSIPARGPADPWWPIDTVFWPLANASRAQTGTTEVEFGTDALTLAMWFKPVTNALMVMCSNNNVYQTGGLWKFYGGMTVLAFPEPADPTKMAVTLAVYGAKGAPAEIIMMQHWRDIPGYSVGTFMHFALCRDSGGVWSVYLDGVKAGTPTLVTGVAETVHVSAGGTGFMIGNWALPTAKGLARMRYAGEMVIDDPLLITGNDLYSEAFTPPTAAYNLI